MPNKLLGLKYSLRQPIILIIWAVILYWYVTNQEIIGSSTNPKYNFCAKIDRKIH